MQFNVFLDVVSSFYVLNILKSSVVCLTQIMPKRKRTSFSQMKWSTVNTLPLSFLCHTVVLCAVAFFFSLSSLADSLHQGKTYLSLALQLLSAHSFWVV